MLRHIHVETTTFGPGDDAEEARKDICWWLEALTQRNQDYLARHPDTPRIYKSGIKYIAPKQFGGMCEEESVLRKALGSSAQVGEVARVLDLVGAVFGGEHFCDIGVILELGGIDCDGCACWRAAELRQAGIKARPYMTHRERPGGGTIYHALVLWPPMPGVAMVRGVPKPTSEDPSLLLGMGGPARAADRAEEIRKNVERCDYFRGNQPSGSASDSGFDIDAALSDILGTRKRDDAMSAATELDAFFKRAA